MPEENKKPETPKSPEIPKGSITPKDPETLKDSETVMVDKKKFEALVDQVGKYGEEISKLNAVADKSRLEWFNRSKEKQGPSRFKLSTYNGKIIVAWSTVKDLVEKNIATKTYYEHQEYEIILEDGKKYKIVGYNKFANVQYEAQINAEEISRTVSDEVILLKLRVIDTGQEIEIDSRFVN